MADLKTSEALLNALREASARPVSPSELHAQRVSFIMGSVKADSWHYPRAGSAGAGKAGGFRKGGLSDRL